MEWILEGKKISYGFLFITLLFGACSSPESLVEQPEDNATEEEIMSPAPSWYKASVPSSADSVAFYGYALASSFDSIQAAELSREAATHNMRIEIDRFSELARRSMQTSEYDMPAFIIRLRNAVRLIDLTDVEIDMKTEYSDEGIYYVYSKAVINIEDAVQQLANHLGDALFIRQIFTME